MGNHAVRNPKAVCFTLWFSTHNNPRYADLFPRFDTLVRFYKVTLSGHRLLRGVQYRLWHALRKKLIYPRVLRYLSQRYETLFTVDCSQIPMWSRPESVVVDIDDPVFTPAEVYALNMPQVRAIVVTTEKAKGIFQSLGVKRPIHVIPQGVPVGHTDPQKVEALRRQFKSDSDVIVGYHAPTLTMSADGSNRRRSDQDDLDFLFRAFDDARKSEPRLKLWLFGKPSEALKEHVDRGHQSSVKLFGYVPFSEMLNYLANVDIGIYPRTWTPPPARFSVKIAQFMACRIPVVSRDLDESFVLREARCGIVCKTQEDFSRALVELTQSAEKRAELGRAGLNYAQTNLDWSVLVPVYKKILME
jgi:glycosyltransferase involved in cell wall biosynthesis